MQWAHLGDLPCAPGGLQRLRHDLIHILTHPIDSLTLVLESAARLSS